MASSVTCRRVQGQRLAAQLGLVAALAACSREPDVRDASNTDTAQLTPAPAGTGAPVTAKASAVVPPAPASEPAQAAAPAPASKGSTAVVGQTRLVLTGCRLEAELPRAGRQTKDIDLPGGCVFVTTTSGAQIVKTEQGDTVLVVSSQPLEGSPGDCDTRVRAVVLKSDGLAVSSEQQVIRMCGAEGPFDSLMFHALAASAKG